MKQPQPDPTQAILKPTGNELSPVKEQTMYPAQFPIYLRHRLQGLSVADVAALLEIKAGDVNRLLQGQWRPSKEICRRLGLKVVYAIAK